MPFGKKEKGREEIFLFIWIKILHINSYKRIN